MIALLRPYGAPDALADTIERLYQVECLWSFWPLEKKPPTHHIRWEYNKGTTCSPALHASAIKKMEQEQNKHSLQIQYQYLTRTLVAKQHMADYRLRRQARKNPIWTLLGPTLHWQFKPSQVWQWNPPIPNKKWPWENYTIHLLTIHKMWTHHAHWEKWFQIPNWSHALPPSLQKPLCTVDLDEKDTIP